MANLSRFTGGIEPDRFVEAVNEVVESSDALRLQVREIDGVPHPTTAAAPTSMTTVVELDTDDVEQWIHERLATPLDTAVSVYDSVLLDHGSGRWSWWMNVHHIATDAASSALIFKAVAAAYAGEFEPGMSYAELSAELHDAQDSKRWRKAMDHWNERPTHVASTPLYQPPTAATTLADRVNVPLHGSRQQRFDALLGDRFHFLSADLSRSIALTTVIACYLHRLNGSTSITIGMPIHHRASRASKTVIGPLIELFPVTVEVEVDDTFATLQERTAASVFDMLRHAQPGVSPRQNFDVVLNNVAATFGSFGDIPTTTTWIHPGHIDAHHRMRVQALDYDGNGQLQLALDLNHAVAGPVHRQRAGDHFGAVLDAMLADPDSRCDSFGLATEDDLADMVSFTDPSPSVRMPGFAPELVENFLAAAGGRTVLTESGTSLTGSELNERIDRVAGRLRGAGVGLGHLVAIELPISTDAVVAIHGVLRAGAAFVPIDPAYPAARRDHIRNDSGATLTIRSLAELDNLAETDTPTKAVCTGDDLAYVIYTSGSTGLPKGVPITHAGLAEYLGFALTSYVGESGPIMPLYTSLSFDLTITTLFLPFISGGAMTVHPEGGLPALRQIVDDGAVTLMKATPSHLELLVRMIEPGHPLAGLIVGGEAFMSELADEVRISCGPETAIWNEYGPTEAVVGCMLHRYDPRVDDMAEVPIGQNAPGVALHVLDAAGHPVPLGVEGELYINRPGMTSGYLGRPELNAEKFGLRPATGSDAVVYRTGDRVRMLDAERMVYHGRIDEQIKVRGVRLEPGEIETAARSIDGVAAAVAGLWVPDRNPTIVNCVRCGLGSDVPDIVIDADGVCTSCHEFDAIAPQAEAWFRTEADLQRELAEARNRSAGNYDVLHLLSGGKDSTYALYRLVEMGARVLAITLDNGFIAEGAKDNVRRASAALGVDHEFVTVDAMNEIFRDSLERFSNVCNGCYKAIYTIALERAERLGIPAIVTGLSRGQFFETRLVPGLFGEDRFDPNSIDTAVTEARRIYHRTPDAVSENMDVAFLEDGTIFDRVSFIDFYRYVDVELSEMYRVLESSGTWERPEDSGRSTNCLINAAGIYVHKIEQAHHNYALPYSWDVRLGHKTRAEAMFELDDPMDESEMAAITDMLAAVGYEPRQPEVLTLWVQPADDAELDLDAIRQELSTLLPAHAHPQAIEVIDNVPLTVNGKVDAAALPAPAARRTLPAAASGRLPETTTEQQIASVWANVLSLASVAATDDFFSLGGTSLHALEMIVRVSDRCGVKVNESLAFTHRTVAELAVAVEALRGTPDAEHHVVAMPDLDGQRPMSAGEEAMLYEWRRDPADLRYNVARLYYLPEGYDRVRFDAAVRSVVAHQATLHTSYGPHRSVLDIDAAVRITEASSEHASLEGLATQLNQQRFDLVNGPLVTVHHLTSAWDADADLDAVLLRTHHIVSDAGSLDVMWQQIDAAYRGEGLPALPVSYAEHGEWQRENQPSVDDLWLQPGDPELGTLRIVTPAAEADGYVHMVAPVTTAGLRGAAGTTPFASALAALTAALRPWHDADSFEIAVTGSVRDHPSVADVVGYFLNPLPLVQTAQAEQSLGALAEETSAELARMLEYRTVPFAEVIAAARRRGVAEPGAGVMLAFEDLAPAELDGAPAHHTILPSGSAVNDLTFFVQIRGQLVELGCEYRGTSVGRHAATVMLSAFADGIAALVERPTASVGSQRSAEDAEDIVGDPITVEALVPALIDDAAAANPDAIVVRSGSDELTHAELDQRAADLGGRLRAIGVEPGHRVGIVLPRSVDLIVAIRAVWMLGASYVPIDVAQPATRLQALLSDAAVSVVVVQGTAPDGVDGLVHVDVAARDTAVLPLARHRSIVPETEAYVIFTSGSTGRPKGVSINHGNLAASLAARRAWYDTPVDGYLLLSSAGFDSSVAGIFWSLTESGTLVIPTEDEVHDVDALLGLLESTTPTHTLCVPSLYGAMLQRHGGALPGLQTVIVAGEACPPEVLKRHRELAPTVDLINEYGPTEATVWATAHRISDLDGSDVVPIGAPIPGVTARVVDPGGRPLPAHVAGELWILGPTLAVGYLGDAEEPSDEGSAFITVDGQRAYRTGDRVVARAGGVLEFLGRVDDQLSVGGVRIEPAEIEITLMRQPGVTAAAVGMQESRLAAWIEAEGTDAATVRASIANELPTTHTPATITVVDALPRTANGKVDRAALVGLAVHTPPPVPTAVEAVVSADLESSPSESDEVLDDTVVGVVEIWEQAFDGLTVSADDDFFDIGGDSLRAVELVGLLELRFGRRVAIGELIDASTPRLLADRLRPSMPSVTAPRSAPASVSAPVEAEIDADADVESDDLPEASAVAEDVSTSETVEAEAEADVEVEPAVEAATDVDDDGSELAAHEDEAESSEVTSAPAPSSRWGRVRSALTSATGDETDEVAADVELMEPADETTDVEHDISDDALPEVNEEPTEEVAYLAQPLPDDRTSQGLVEWLRSSGDDVPLVVLPPGGGNLLRYAPLVRTLDRSIPVVGIRLPGADARSATIDTIEGQAEAMLAALDSTMSSGPYRLLGWSTGGLIAWEMARMIIERGDEVELVGLIDTLMGGMSAEEPQSPKDKYAELLDEGGVKAVLGEGFGRIRERTEFGLARRRYRSAREQGSTPDMADAERHLGPVIRRASAAYSPAPLDARVLYLAASESGTELTIDPWTALQAPIGELDIVTIEGTHYLPEETCIVGPGGVGDLVQALTSRLHR